jgi:hypothetical protein
VKTRTTAGDAAPIPGQPAAGTARADVVDLLACLVAAGLIVLIEQGALTLARAVLAFCFAFFVPGRAIVSNWPEIARWSAWAISMVLSLAVVTLLATTALWAGVWHPLGLFEIEAWLSLAGLAVGIARRHRRTSAGAVGRAQARPGSAPRAEA